MKAVVFVLDLVLARLPGIRWFTECLGGEKAVVASAKRVSKPPGLTMCKPTGHESSGLNW